MKRFQLYQYAAAAIASVGFVSPSGVLAAEANRAPVRASAAATPSIVDVSLGEGGTLTGQVLNAQGIPLAQTAVTVRGAGSEVVSAVTDAQGSFAVHGLKGGVFEVSGGGGTGAFRLWTAQAGPPSASKSVLIVAGGPISRGQQSYAVPRPPGPLTNGQILIGGAAIAGIAAGITAWAMSENRSAS